MRKWVNNKKRPFIEKVGLLCLLLEMECRADLSQVKGSVLQSCSFNSPSSRPVLPFQNTQTCASLSEHSTVATEPSWDNPI